MCPKRCPHRYCRPAVPPRSVPRHRRVRPRGSGLHPAARGGGGRRVGLRADQSSELTWGAACPRGAERHDAGGRPTGSGGYRRARGGLLRQRPPMLGGGRGRTQSGALGGRDHRDRGHHQWRRVVEGSAGGRREHAAAERGLLPHRDRCMAVGSNGASLPGSGVVVTTTDAGTTWAPAMSPDQRTRGDQCRVHQPRRAAPPSSATAR